MSNVRILEKLEENKENIDSLVNSVAISVAYNTFSCIIPYDEICIYKVLSEGYVCDVHLGTWNEKWVVIKEAIAPEGCDFISSEISILQQLMPYQLPTVVNYYGVSISSKGYPEIVLEYKEAGDAYDWLFKFDPSSVSILTPVISTVANNIVKAVSALHDVDFIHCDLKLENILIEDNLSVKLIDFAFAKSLNGERYIFDDKSWQSSSYTSAEIFQEKKYSKYSDIYAIGSILYLMSEFRPAWNVNELTHEIVKENVINNKLPEFTNRTPSTLADLIKRCWHKIPEERPSTGQIREELHRLFNKSTVFAKSEQDSDKSISQVRLRA